MCRRGDIEGWESKVSMAMLQEDPGRRPLSRGAGGAPRKLDWRSNMPRVSVSWYREAGADRVESVGNRRSGKRSGVIWWGIREKVREGGSLAGGGRIFWAGSEASNL